MYLGITPTLILLALGVGVFLLARWQSSRPAQPEKGPRMIAWTPVAIAAAVLVLFMLASLAAHMGINLERNPR
jgi:predicted MFS family arabinose efflux permease